ncbi:unnamed protein product [Aspergillus oryzae]|nr:unnamed protein product [Aspergillus oryzae]
MNCELWRVNVTRPIGDNARQAAKALDYQFKSDTRLIEALTAPGVEGEGSQGNRWLGDFGIDVIRSCLSFYAYEEKIRPSKESKTPHFFDPERNGVDPAQLESRVDDNPCPSITSPPMGNNREVSQTTGSPVGLEWSTAQSISELENTAAPSVSSGFDGVETENDVQIVRQENQKRKALAPSPLEDKNGMTKAKQVRRSTNDQVAAYLVREAIKCKAQNLQTPQESYFTVEVESRLLKACNNRSVEVAKKLLLCIGSSQSILSLQDAIQSWRTGTYIRFLQMPHCSSKADTFDIISKMSQGIACLYLFRRYHIVRLFEKCGGFETPSVSRFVAVPVNNSAVLKRPGNPLKNAETELNIAMMKEVLPHLKPGTSEYEEEYNCVYPGATEEFVKPSLPFKMKNSQTTKTKTATHSYKSNCWFIWILLSASDGFYIVKGAGILTAHEPVKASYIEGLDLYSFIVYYDFLECHIKRMSQNPNERTTTDRSTYGAFYGSPQQNREELKAHSPEFGQFFTEVQSEGA